MKENINKIKEVINMLVEEIKNDITSDNYQFCGQKIRAIDDLLHAITLIKEK